MITEALTEFVTGTAVDDVPENVVSRAGDVLVDTVGVAIAGSREPVAAIARRSLPARGEGPCAIWASTDRVCAEDAVFINAIQIHVLDFDDSALRLRGHPSSTMMSTAVAAGEESGASGHAVLAAYAIGLEVAIRVSQALTSKHYLDGWHTTATAGVFGATSIAGRLFGLNRLQMRHAFGLAAAQAGGLTRNFGTMAKAFQTGHAARAGIQAARLALAGADADPHIFDGPKGFLALYGNPSSDEIARKEVGNFGQRWELVDPGTFVKKWPCCYAVHRPVAGLLEMQREHGFTAADVKSVVVGFLPGVEHPLNQFSPSNGLEAKFSIEYAAAAALIDGDLSAASFADEAVLRPEAQALQARVRRFTIPHEGVFNGLTGFNDLVVETATERLEHRIDRTPGSPEWPLSVAEQDAKFLSCVETVLERGDAVRLLARTRAAPSLADIRHLFAVGGDGVERWTGPGP
jgi:2-methylcitrate dehydratase PrpD